MRSKEDDKSKALRSLEKDLINGPMHWFGHHHHCSPDFCSTARERVQQPTVLSTEDEAESSDTDDEDDSTLIGISLCL